MLFINQSQVAVSAECKDVETNESLAYFDANYTADHIYLSMTIYQDDPQIMTDFATFKEEVVTARDEQGVITIGTVVEEEEEEPVVETPVEG